MINLMLRIPNRKEHGGLSGTLAAAALMSAVLMPQASRAAEPVYPVVSPLGEVTVEMVEMAPRPATLANSTVCMVSNNSFKVDVTNPAIATALEARYPGIRVVRHTGMPYTELPGARAGASAETFAAAFQSQGCDAVVSGNGG